MLPMRIGDQSAATGCAHHAMRDSEGRLLGAVTTLEDVTSLRDTDRFKTQFIAVASRKLRDPLLQLRRGLYALAQGFSGEMTNLQTELVHRRAKSGNLGRSDGRPDWSAELDTGKRELRPSDCGPAVLNEARDRFCDEAHGSTSGGCERVCRPGSDRSRSPRNSIDSGQSAVECPAYTAGGAARSCWPRRRSRSFVQFSVRDTAAH